MSGTISVEDIRLLRDEYIGLTLTAAVSGTKNRDRVNTWCNGALAPDENEARRLKFTLEILREVAGAEHSMGLARNWFMGGNVGDDLLSPWEAIRTDRFDEVCASARRMTSDIPFSA